MNGSPRGARAEDRSAVPDPIARQIADRPISLQPRLASRTDVERSWADANPIGPARATDQPLDRLEAAIVFAIKEAAKLVQSPAAPLDLVTGGIEST